MTTEEIKKQMNDIHQVADPTVCMMADQNPDKMCVEKFEIYKDSDGKFKTRLTGITLEDKN